MNETSNINTELDPDVQEMLRAYAAIPERDPHAAGRTQTKFLNELGKVFPGSVRLNPVGVPPSPGSWLAGLRNALVPFIRQRAVAYTVVALMVCGVFLFGGVGISAYAASMSLPGDAMYPLKTTLETAQARFAGDPETQARLYMTFAGRRLSEMQVLIESGRYADISQAADVFEREIQMALQSVETLSEDDPARAAALNEEITSMLHEYSTTLMQMAVVIPAHVQPVIQHAIDSAGSAAGDDDDLGDDVHGETGIATPDPELTVTPTLAPTSTAVPTSTLMPAPTDPTAPGSGSTDEDDDDDDDDDDEDDDDD